MTKVNCYAPSRVADISKVLRIPLVPTVIDLGDAGAVVRPATGAGSPLHGARGHAAAAAVGDAAFQCDRQEKQARLGAVRHAV